MKRKFVALFMIAIMALTVTTVAVTAKPVNAASTQAGAATGGSSNAKAPNLVGLGVVGTPAVCFDQGGIFKGYVFERGTGGALWYMTWNDQGSSSWMSLSGYLTSDPTVISTWYGEIIVSARGGGRCTVDNSNFGWRSLLEPMEQDRRAAPRGHRPHPIHVDKGRPR